MYNMYKVVEEGKEWMVVKVIFTKGNSSRGGDIMGPLMPIIDY